MADKTKKHKTIKQEKSKLAGSLITSNELIMQYKISRATIERWRKEGLPYQKIGRGVRFDKDAVAQWIERAKSLPNNLASEQGSYNSEIQSRDARRIEGIRSLEQLDTTTFKQFNSPRLDSQEQEAFKNVIENKRQALEVDFIMNVFRKILRQYGEEYNSENFFGAINDFKIEMKPDASFDVLKETENDLLAFEKRFIKRLIENIEDASITIKEAEESGRMKKQDIESRKEILRDIFWNFVKKGVEERAKKLKKLKKSRKMAKVNSNFIE